MEGENFPETNYWDIQNSSLIIPCQFKTGYFFYLTLVDRCFLQIRTTSERKETSITNIKGFGKKDGPTMKL